MNPFADILDADIRYGLAFSGGVDSSYLLAALVKAGYDVKAYLVKTAFQADWEVRDARQAAAVAGAPLQIIEADVLSQERICANPPDRCYWCKRFIFGTLEEALRLDDRTVLLDGTNASDDPSRRPGMKALGELGVISPLRQAGMTKDDVRQASRTLGLFTADKPNFSCYAVHAPSGMPITQDVLDQVALETKEAAQWNSAC